MLPIAVSTTGMSRRSALAILTGTVRGAALTVGVFSREQEVRIKEQRTSKAAPGRALTLRRREVINEVLRGPVISIKLLLQHSFEPNHGHVLGDLVRIKGVELTSSKQILNEGVVLDRPGRTAGRDS